MGGDRDGPVRDVAVVSPRGAQRWERGHPWIFRSDVRTRPSAPAGVVRVRDDRGRWLGVALWSPTSEISLRLLDPNTDVSIDGGWWHDRLAVALNRRIHLANLTSACRLVHAEGDGLPALICDRYDRWLVVQLLSAAVETFREPIVEALLRLTGAEGVLARNDVPLRSREKLARETVLLHGHVPEEVIVNEHGVKYAAAPWTGQKTGAFLDQRENRVLLGSLTHGRALDCFSYHGSFALHMARGAEQVIAVDSSADAIARARANAALNDQKNVECVEANAFDYLRDRDREGDRFDTIALDPPAFAKNRDALDAALRGYHEINLRAMRLLAPGGVLYTASCSFHLTKSLFLEMIERAAQDSGRQLVLRQLLGQPADHPELITIPETGYLKGAILQAVD
ncbi:MAG TPA: class I SAM-dependent rRNA methyltransferase [Gemmatimonadaceae bacterium]